MMRFEMGVTQEDQQLLEDWLDGELSEPACDELRARLSRDPSLTAQLTRLQSERQVRSSFWQCCEPSTAQIESIANLVRRDCRRHQVVQQRIHMLRNGAALAATFAVVFASGWMGRSGMIQQDQSFSPETRVSNAFPVMMPKNIAAQPPDYLLPQVNPWRNAESVGYPVDSRGLSTRRPTFKLALVDPMGTMIDSQEFDDIHDTRKIAKSFSDLQTRMESAQRPDTTMVDQVVPLVPRR